MLPPLGLPPLTTLIVDDEAGARRHLRALLAAHPDVIVGGEAEDGPGAVEAVAALRPDLVLLDVELPELSGVAVAAALAVFAAGSADALSAAPCFAPAVVFTTAYERYAVGAFDVAAVDYLLKPFGARRLAVALDRVRTHRRALAAGRVVGPPSDGPPPGPGGPSLPRGHLLVRTGRRLVPVRAADIVRLEADDDYVHVHTAGARHLVTARLGVLVAQLAPWALVRVHRSHAVNLAHVTALDACGDGRLAVRLRDGARVVASRAGSRLLRAWDDRRAPPDV